MEIRFLRHNEGKTWLYRSEMKHSLKTDNLNQYK